MKTLPFALFMQKSLGNRGARKYLLDRGRCLELAGYPARAWAYRRAAMLLAQLGERDHA